MLHPSIRASRCLLNRSVRLCQRSSFSSSAAALDEHAEVLNAPRDAMEYDVCIVGAGPAGLGAALRLKQLSEEKGKDLSVVVVEKGAEVGAHILSGNVFEPRALDELLPDWREDDSCPISTPVKDDQFHFLTNEKSSISVPMVLHPPAIHNDGNYIISLSQMCRWLGAKCEEAGVEIYPGFSASEVLYREDGGVGGVATADVGIDKDGTPKGTFARGMELRARQTLFAEGARGSCSESIMKQFDLRKTPPHLAKESKSEADPQSYALGVKEVWQVPEEQCKPGTVIHTWGWPLTSMSNPFDKTYGGAFLYHMEPNLVMCGFVTGLDYENPYISPYQTFQQWKTHPKIRPHLENGECIQYGARVLNEGGYYAVPKLTFPGGMLVGCSAGFLNALKIKGSHTALKSGMVAAEAVFEDLVENSDVQTVWDYQMEDESGEPAIKSDEASVEVQSFGTRMEESWVFDELRETRNFHGAFHKGHYAGFINAGITGHLTKGKEPWTFRNDSPDSAKTKPAANFKEIQYPNPDGVLTFDLLTNLARSGTNHEDQPSHLKIKEELKDIPSKTSLPEFAGPEQRFCPAKVYEYNEDNELVINAQNCVHCKCCSIKMPHEYINWTVPEGGGGPAYDHM